MAGKIIDKTRIPEIIRTLKQLNSKTIQIGVFGEDDGHIAMVANVQEFGLNISVSPKMRAYLHYKGIHLSPSKTSIDIPARPFISKAFDDNEAKIEKTVKSLLPKVIQGTMSVDSYYGVLGELLVGLIHKQIRKTTDPPNSKMTIEQKGSSHPLIDTGRMNQAVTYKVVSR